MSSAIGIFSARCCIDCMSLMYILGLRRPPRNQHSQPCSAADRWNCPKNIPVLTLRVYGFYHVPYFQILVCNQRVWIGELMWKFMKTVFSDSWNMLGIFCKPLDCLLPVPAAFLLPWNSLLEAYHWFPLLPRYFCIFKDFSVRERYHIWWMSCPYPESVVLPFRGDGYRVPCIDTSGN